MDERTWLQREVKALYDITQAINSSFSQDAVLTALVENIVSQLGYRAASIRLLDEEQQLLGLKAASGLSEAYLSKGDVALSRSGIDQQALNGEWVVIPEISQNAGFQYPDEAQREGLVSMLAVPLRAHAQAMGVLHVYTAQPHQFSPEEQSFIAAAANLGAQAIVRSHLFESFQRAAHQLTASLDPKDVLKALLLESTRALNYKAGSIRLLGPNRATLHLAAAYGLSDAYLKLAEINVADSPADQAAIQQAKPVGYNTVTREAGFIDAEHLTQEDIRSVLVLPLMVQGVVVGVMRLYSGRERLFSAESLNFAEAIASLGGVAIENARLHKMMEQRLEALKEDADGWYRFLSMG